MSNPQALTYLSVLNPGIYSLLVDFGRPHSRALGVPVGGAADRTALAMGNALLGNAPEALALEISLAGPTVRAEGEIAGVVFGADFELSSNRQSLTVGKTFTLKAQEELHIGGVRQGVRAYFCVHGGFLAPRILDSFSALEPLHVKANLACAASRTNVHFVNEVFPNNGEQTVLRVLPGRQTDWFAPTEMLAFFANEFTIRPESNRMGLRLDGLPLRLADRELVSEPVCPGSVQVTRDGQCIVLGCDGQTIGGYPKIAQVISADLDKLAQLRPGTLIRFEQVEQLEAERLYRTRQRELHDWMLRVRTAAADDY